jgi:hypothetical protein
MTTGNGILRKKEADTMNLFEESYLPRQRLYLPPAILFRATSFEVVEAELGEDVYSPL